MTKEQVAIWLAVGANVFFSLASLAYADFSKRVSPYWVNALKSYVCFVAFALTLPFAASWDFRSWTPYAAWFLSGLIALNIGDLLLLMAFARMGAARTILFFGLQPFLLAGWAALQFGQPITIESLASMLLLLCCLGMLSLENFKKKGHWELVGMGLALLGIILDAGGVVLSRWGLDLAPHVPVAEAQFFRSFGAVAGFVVMSFWVPLRLVPRMRTLSRRDRWMVLTASLAGTYVSLMFYLSAIKIGHLASVSSIAAAGPLFTSVVEHLYKREPPSRYFVAAITFFCLSFALVLAPEGLLLRLLESLGIFGT